MKLIKCRSFLLLLAFLRYLNLVHHVDMPPDQHWYCILFFITGRNEVVAKAIFLHLFVILFTGGVSSRENPRQGDPQAGRTHLARRAPWQGDPPYFIVAMSFERFYSIIRPLNAGSFITVKRAKITVVRIVTFTFLYYSPHWFITSNHQTMCISNKYLSVNVHGKLYYWLSESISFILPFMLLLVMNSAIIHTLRQRFKLNLMASGSQEQSEYNNNRSSDKQIYRILILVTFGYLVLSLPGKIVIFYLNIYRENTPQFIARFHLIGQLAAKVYYTNHGVNFFFFMFSLVRNLEQI